MTASVTVPIAVHASQLIEHCRMVSTELDSIKSRALRRGNIRSGTGPGLPSSATSRPFHFPVLVLDTWFPWILYWFPWTLTQNRGKPETIGIQPRIASRLLAAPGFQPGIGKLCPHFAGKATLSRGMDCPAADPAKWKADARRARGNGRYDTRGGLQSRGETRSKGLGWPNRECGRQAVAMAGLDPTGQVSRPEAR